ncbi:MAG: hypothetical protein ABI770_08805 [Sphingomicrobium sp.]
MADRMAAALFAGAVGFAFFSAMERAYHEPQLALFTASAAVLAFLVCARSLARVEPEGRSFNVPVFELPEIVPDNLDELLLTDRLDADELLLTDQIAAGELILTEADRVHPLPDAADELVLDDILAELGPDSRVVRLFDPAAMPAPAQLNARIERHLGAATSSPPPVDESQALYDALADLRRSLR